VETVDGVSTIIKIVMDNVNSGGSSEIDVTKVIRNKQLPADTQQAAARGPIRSEAAA
jgi:hypothetical protein